MTIIEAVQTILQHSTTGMTSKEIYQGIIEQNLYVFPAKNPAAVVNSIIRRHCAGLNFPTASLVKYFTIEKCIGKKTYYTLLSEVIEEKAMSAADFKQNQASDMLPEERIQVAYDDYIKEIKSQLLDTIMSNSPSFFEHLIVDLLLKMGYGDESSAKVTGGPHDGGIDGVIYEDALGLDLIYLQAKRYKMDNPVGRRELQAFVGAMQNVQKGVFITTSSFTKEAVEYGNKQQQKNLKLVDGTMLASLMVRYEVGVVSRKTIKICQIDNNYFGL